MLCLAAAGALFVGPAALLAELPGAALRLCGVELAQTAASAPDSGLFLPMLLQSALLAPICEELFFRGYLMGAFARAGRGKAAAAAALLFAAAHGVDAAFLPRFLFGCLLGAMAQRTGSILAPMLMHGCYNAAVLLVSFSGLEACGKLAAFLRAGIDERGALLCDGCARLSRAGEPRARRMGRCAEQKGNGEDCRGRAGGYHCRNRIGGDETVNMALICMGRLKEKLLARRGGRIREAAFALRKIRGNRAAGPARTGEQLARRRSADLRAGGQSHPAEGARRAISSSRCASAADSSIRCSFLEKLMQLRRHGAGGWCLSSAVRWGCRPQVDCAGGLQTLVFA